jgi:predicted CoA-binding protein
MARVPASIVTFLEQRRLAVVGVSRNSKETANFIYRTLRNRGYQVYAVNPNAGSVEGDTCYPDLAALPEPVGGVLAVTSPEIANDVVRACGDCGIPRVWMHRSFGSGSVSQSAVALGRERGMTVIAGGCPLMYCKPVDPGHRCMRWVLNLMGRLPDS